MTRWIAIGLIVAACALPAALVHAAPAAGHNGAESNGAPHNGEGGSEGMSVNPNPLEFDPDLAIVTAIVFFCLLAVLYKFAWGPIVAGLQKREANIADEIAAAEASNKEAHKLLGEYEQRLQKASEDVRAMLDDAKKEAESMKQTIIAEAQKAASDEKDRATREIASAKKAAIDEITEQSVNLAFRVAGEAVRREIRPDDHRALVEDALKQFSNEN